MSQALTSNGGVNSGGVDQQLNQIEQQQQSELQQLQPHQPSLFRRILGGVAGMAGNMFAPGLGGALGNLIGGGSSFASGLGASGSAANAANLAAANQLLAVAKQSNEDEEMTELASNLEKSKHETFMAVIQNIT
jgi:homoserine kinase